MDDPGELSQHDADQLIAQSTAVSGRRTGTDLMRLLVALRADGTAPPDDTAASKLLLAHMVASIREAADEPPARARPGARVVGWISVHRARVALAVLLVVVTGAVVWGLMGRSSGSGRLESATASSPDQTTVATTAAPTTAASTTAAPTTAAPTTAVSSSAAPSTATPATDVPSSPVPSEPPTTAVETSIAEPATVPVTTAKAAPAPITTVARTVPRAPPTTTAVRVVVVTTAPSTTTPPPVTTSETTPVVTTPATAARDTNTLCKLYNSGDSSVLGQLQQIANQAGESVSELCAPPPTSPATAPTTPST